MICAKCKKEIVDDSKFCEFCGNKIKNIYIKLADEALKEKSLSELNKLNKKVWYRALKVLYFFGITFGIMISLGIASDEDSLTLFVFLIIATFIIAEIIKGTFYYIYLGEIFPKNKG